MVLDHSGLMKKDRILWMKRNLRVNLFECYHHLFHGGSDEMRWIGWAEMNVFTEKWNPSPWIYTFWGALIWATAGVEQSLPRPSGSSLRLTNKQTGFVVLVAVLLLIGYCFVAAVNAADASLIHYHHASPCGRLRAFWGWSLSGYECLLFTMVQNRKKNTEEIQSFTRYGGIKVGWKKIQRNIGYFLVLIK